MPNAAQTMAARTSTDGATVQQRPVAGCMQMREQIKATEMRGIDLINKFKIPANQIEGEPTDMDYRERTRILRNMLSILHIECPDGTVLKEATDYINRYYTKYFTL